MSKKTKAATALFALAIVTFASACPSFAVEHSYKGQAPSESGRMSPVSGNVPASVTGPGASIKPVDARNGVPSAATVAQSVAGMASALGPANAQKIVELARSAAPRSEAAVLASEKLSSLREKLGKLDQSETEEVRKILTAHFEKMGTSAADDQPDLVAVVHAEVSRKHRNASDNISMPVALVSIGHPGVSYFAGLISDEDIRRMNFLSDLRTAIEARNPHLAPYFTRVALAWRGNVPAQARKRYQELEHSKAANASLRAQRRADPASFGATGPGQFARIENVSFDDSSINQEMDKLEEDHPDLKRSIFQRLSAAIRGDVSSYRQEEQETTKEPTIYGYW